jgi:hypothetical protein
MSLDTRFEHELKKRISEEIEKLRDTLEIQVNATIISPPPAYYSGQIAALRRVISDYIPDINTTISER